MLLHTRPKPRQRQIKIPGLRFETSTRRTGESTATHPLVPQRTGSTPHALAQHVDDRATTQQLSAIGAVVVG